MRYNPHKAIVAKQLALLAIRAGELADRVALGQIGFLDAVDLAYSAAEHVGLVDLAGDNEVQLVLAAAFATARRPEG